MKFRTHILFALVLSYPFYRYVSIPLISYLFLASWASLIPDIDHPKSYLGSSATSKIIRLTTTHRGWTHSLFGMIIFSAIFALFLHLLKLEMPYIIPFTLGYISHLISDSLNPTGVRWFWPSKRRVRVGLIATGSKREKIFSYLLIGILIVEILYSIKAIPIYFL